MRLVDYPWVVVRLSCRICPRHGRTRLARLAERYGAEIELEDMLDRIAWTCPYPRRPEPGRKPRKYQPYCGIYLADFDGTPRPPDRPGGAGLRLVSSREAPEEEGADAPSQQQRAAND